MTTVPRSRAALGEVGEADRLAQPEGTPVDVAQALAQGLLWGLAPEV
jgi:hypothetical protein